MPLLLPCADEMPVFVNHVAALLMKPKLVSSKVCCTEYVVALELATTATEILNGVSIKSG